MIRYQETLPATADLVVVGGGIVGAATAFFATAAGLSTVLLERRAAVATLTTPASTGAFRLQFDNRDEWELVRESVAVFESFAEVTGQRVHASGIARHGYLFCTTEAARARAQGALVGRQHEWGQTDIELLDGDEVRRRFPFISPTVVSARFRGADGFVDPVAVTRGFLAGSSAVVVTGCGATGFSLAGGGLTGVETALGTIATGAAVIAAGPFSGHLAGSLGISLPIAVIDRQKVVVPDLPEVPPDAPMTIDDDTGTHWRPYEGGAAVLFTDPDATPTEPAERVGVDRRHAESVLDPASPRAAARIAPFWRTVWERRPAWTAHTGQYVMTPDHRPLLGPVGPSGLFVNTGYSGHGIMGSPAGSRHLVDLIVGRASKNPFAVDRAMVERARDVL